MKNLWNTLKKFLLRERTELEKQLPPLHAVPFPYRDEYIAEVEAEQPKEVKSQTATFINEIQAHGKVSVSWMQANGVYRGKRIVSELRKKGWDIKTNIIVKDGSKDIVYTLIQEPQPIGI